MNRLFEEKIQRLLNNYLKLDPESAQRIMALEDKVVNVQLDALNGIVLQLHFSSDSININTSDMREPNTIIKGKPLSLLHLSLAKQDRKKFFSDDVSIEGDVELGQKVIALFDELEIDWEEYLSHWIGDIPAHNLGVFAKKIVTFTKKFRDTLAENINEYTHEEIRLFPPKEELQDFFQEVDNLRMDVDRLDAKVEQLMQSIKE